jgi:hypothetical protein
MGLKREILMANGQHLLVPIKVQALVIDDLVIEKKATLKIGVQKSVANDGKWSPLEQDYRPLTLSLSSPAPKPFYGARDTYKGQRTDQLVLEADSPALPEMKDRGVYLHWVLPSGLRHAYTPGALDFPALPDQWLITRFCRRGAELQTRAWFVDGGLVVDSNDPANLLMESGNQYTARRVGKVIPLDELTPDKLEGERTTITAVGNRQTGSPTFTAFVAENRNILSWHDDLADLRVATDQGNIPKATALSYLLLGWYRDEQNEPLAALPVKLVEQRDEQDKLLGGLVEPLGWFIDSASSLPADLLKRRSLFHGMVAHINYWNPGTYKGPMLGYPGSPSVEGVLGDATPSFKVGVGNNAEDALVSLVSSEYSGAAESPVLWKALEAVMYRQPESLIGSWNAAPRDLAVHQSWFSAREAGKIWSIRQRPGQQATFPTDPDATSAQTAAKPTAKQLAALKQLNERQAEADALGRELVALQQDLYARWWKLCEISRLDESTYPEEEENACKALAGRLETLRGERDTLLKQLRPLPEELKRKLPQELELHFDAAPRFWTPADPVIVVKNCGLPTKHQFPNPLPCRLPEQIITAAEVVVAQLPAKFNAAVCVREIAAAVQTRFATRSEILSRLLAEASLVEQAISDLVERTLATERLPFSADAWRDWTDRLSKDITWDGNTKKMPGEQIRFNTAGRSSVPPHRLVDLWGQQPWSPLFLDWQITWFPSAPSDLNSSSVWRMGEHDFQPVSREALPTKGFTVRGRSLLSPVDGRIFEKPIELLRELLKDKQEEGHTTFPKAVRDILSDYEIVWDKTLRQLASAGMMGQALTGFHQTLLRRDVTLPQVMPDPLHPWVAADDIEFRETSAKALLDTTDEAALAAERLAPPSAATSEFDFRLLRAGAFEINELWLVDDFGQWADLLKGTSAGGSAGQVFHPRVRWHEDRFKIAMPPRVVQPTRLNFRFTSADNRLVESDSDPALNPICGWIFYNPLDRALVLCDREGQLAGELVISEEQGRFSVSWQAGAGGGALSEVRNSSLKAFAESLLETAPTTNPRLFELLQLIDRALERIRPAAARRDAALFGRPLALVSAALGLELFGKAWTDPQKKPEARRPERTGDTTLDSLQVRVKLGCSHNLEDGLVGYFKAGAYERIVPARLPPEIKPSGYIAHPLDDAVQAGFSAPQSLTLLMDPWGSVQAATGLVPAKTITLAHTELDKTLARMEASFRVGPVLLQADRLALPTPIIDSGRWNFSGPLTNNAATLIAPTDSRYFSDQPLVAAEGRLLLLNTEE